MVNLSPAFTAKTERELLIRTVQRKQNQREEAGTWNKPATCGYDHALAQLNYPAILQACIFFENINSISIFPVDGIEGQNSFLPPITVLIKWSSFIQTNKPLVLSHTNELDKGTIGFYKPVGSNRGIHGNFCFS